MNLTELIQTALAAHCQITLTITPHDYRDDTEETES